MSQDPREVKLVDEAEGSESDRSEDEREDLEAAISMSLGVNEEYDEEAALQRALRMSMGGAAAESNLAWLGDGEEKFDPALTPVEDEMLLAAFREQEALNGTAELSDFHKQIIDLTVNPLLEQFHQIPAADAILALEYLCSVPMMVDARTYPPLPALFQEDSFAPIKEQLERLHRIMSNRQPEKKPKYSDDQIFGLETGFGIFGLVSRLSKGQKITSYAVRQYLVEQFELKISVIRNLPVVSQLLQLGRTEKPGTFYQAFAAQVQNADGEAPNEMKDIVLADGVLEAILAEESEAANRGSRNRFREAREENSLAEQIKQSLFALPSDVFDSQLTATFEVFRSIKQKFEQHSCYREAIQKLAQQIESPSFDQLEKSISSFNLVCKAHDLINQYRIVFNPRDAVEIEAVEKLCTDYIAYINQRPDSEQTGLDESKLQQLNAFIEKTETHIKATPHGWVSNAITTYLLPYADNKRKKEITAQLIGLTFVQNIILLTDQQIAEQGAFNAEDAILNPNHFVTRVVLHASFVSPDDWTDAFYQTFKAILDALEKRLAAKQKSIYPPIAFVQQLRFLNQVYIISRSAAEEKHPAVALINQPKSVFPLLYFPKTAAEFLITVSALPETQFIPVLRKTILHPSSSMKAENMGELLNALSPEKFELVLLKLKNELIALMDTPRNLGKLLKSLSHAKFDVIVEKTQLFETLIKNPRALGEFLGQFSHRQYEAISGCRYIRHKFQLIIVLDDVCQLINAAEQLDAIAYDPYITSKLNTLLTTPEKLGQLLTCLIPNKFSPFLSLIEQKFKALVKTSEDMAKLLAPLSLEQTRYFLIDTRKRWFKTCIRTIKDVQLLLIPLSPAQCQIVASVHEIKQILKIQIDTAEDLGKFLIPFSADQIRDISTSAGIALKLRTLIQTPEALGQLLNSLTHEQANALFDSPSIKQVFNLLATAPDAVAQFQNQFPPNRADYASAHIVNMLEKFTNTLGALIAFLKQLSVTQLKAFSASPHMAQKISAFIKTPADLIRLLKHFSPKQAVNFFTFPHIQQIFKQLITTREGMEQFQASQLPDAPDDYIKHFLEVTFRTPADLDAFLESLSTEEFNCFAASPYMSEAFSLCIKTPSEMGHFLSKLSRYRRRAAVFSAPMGQLFGRLLTTPAAIGQFLKQFAPNQCHDVLASPYIGQSFNTSVATSEGIGQFLQQLPPTQFRTVSGFAYIKRSIEKLTSTPDELGQVFCYLSLDQISALYEMGSVKKTLQQIKTPIALGQLFRSFSANKLYVVCTTSPVIQKKLKLIQTVDDVVQLLHCLSVEQISTSLAISSIRQIFETHIQTPAVAADLLLHFPPEKRAAIFSCPPIKRLFAVSTPADMVGELLKEFGPGQYDVLFENTVPVQQIVIRTRTPRHVWLVDMTAPNAVGQLSKWFSLEQRCGLFEKIPQTLESSITEPAQIRQLVGYLPLADYPKFFASGVMQPILHRLLTTPAAIGQMLDAFPEEYCGAVCDSIELLLKSKIRIPRELAQLISALSTLEQCSAVYANRMLSPQALISSLPALIELLQELPLEKYAYVFADRHMASALRVFIKEPEDIAQLLQSLSLAQCRVVLDAQIVREVVDTPDKLARLIKMLSAERASVVFEKMTFLIEPLNTPGAIGQFLSRFDIEKFNMLLASPVLKAKLKSVIPPLDRYFQLTHVEALGELLEPLFPGQRRVICRYLGEQNGVPNSELTRWVKLLHLIVRLSRIETPEAIGEFLGTLSLSDLGSVLVSPAIKQKFTQLLAVKGHLTRIYESLPEQDREDRIDLLCQRMDINSPALEAQHEALQRAQDDVLDAEWEIVGLNEDKQERAQAGSEPAEADIPRKNEPEFDDEAEELWDRMKEIIGELNEGKTDAYNQWLAEGKEVDTPDKFGDTLLMCAAGQGYLQAMQMLLDRGANIAFNSHKRRVLSSAIDSGQIEPVRLLLERGADRSKGCYSDTAIDWAYIHHRETAKFLLCWGINNPQANQPLPNEAADEQKFVPAKDPLEKQTRMVRIIHELEETGTSEIFNQWLREGNTVNTLDEADGTLLMYAAFLGKVRAVEFLLANGADADLKPGGLRGTTPLICAIKGGNVQAVAAILSHVEHIDAVCRVWKETALMYAAKNEDPAALQLILALGPNVSLREAGSGCTALTKAVLENRIAAIEILVKRMTPEELNTPTKHIGTTLFRAYIQGAFRATRLLLDHGAVLESPDKKDDSTLHYVMHMLFKDQPDCRRVSFTPAQIEALLDRPAGDRQEATSREWFRLLLERGADPARLLPLYWGEEVTPIVMTIMAREWTDNTRPQRLQAYMNNLHSERAAEAKDDESDASASENKHDTPRGSDAASAAALAGGAHYLSAVAGSSDGTPPAHSASFVPS